MPGQGQNKPKIYRLVYVFEDNSEKSDVKFSGWVRSSQKQKCLDRVNAIQQQGDNSSEGIPPTILGWQELALEELE